MGTPLSSVIGLTGTLFGLHVRIENRSGDSCGSKAGMRINIQHSNGLYCQTAPFPSFWHGEGLELYRSKQELGTCANLDFEVGVDHIAFWVFSTEKVCVGKVILAFSTPKGQVAFDIWTNGGRWFKHGTTSNGIVNYVTNQSRKFKICLYRIKEVLGTPCTVLNDSYMFSP